MPLFNNSGFLLKAGSTCSGTKGYCDIFSKCRTADEGSLLARLEQLLLNPLSDEAIISWFQVRRFVCLFLLFELILMFIAILVGIFIDFYWIYCTYWWSCYYNF
jgi:hypothetical protein